MELIMSLLKKEELSSRKIEVLTTFESSKLANLLTELLERKLIEMTERNTYKLKAL